MKIDIPVSDRISVLNIAAGKMKPLDIGEHCCVINIDQHYYRGSTSNPQDAEHMVDEFKHMVEPKTHWYINEDVFDFMHKTRCKFDRVCIYRFLEHVAFDQVLYFIYLVSTVTKVGGLVDIIVPDYRVLAGMITHEDVYSKDFDRHNILLTTELLNTPGDPHASIWTSDRLVYFWQYERRFEFEQIQDNYLFDNRNIYLRFIVRRI